MRKQWWIIGIVMLSLLSACSSQGVDKSKKAEKKSQKEISNEQKTEIKQANQEEEKTERVTNTPVEIEFWHGLGGQLGEAMAVLVDGFNTSQDKYKVNVVVLGSYSEIDSKLQAAFAGKTAPALVAGGSHETFYKKGLVEPFEHYMPADYDKTDIVGGFMKAAVRDGEMVFAPAYGTSQILYYNKAIFGEAGIETSALSQWQDLAALYDKVKGFKTGPNQIDYVWEPMWGRGNIIDMVSSAGGQIVSDDGKTVVFNTDEWVDVLEQVRGWLHQDKRMRIHSGGQGWEYWYKTMDDWVYGKSLGYTGSPGDYVIALEAVKKAIKEGYKNEFAAAIQPGWKGNPPAPYFTSMMYYITKAENISEQQKKGAAEFITYATKTENTAEYSMSTGYVSVRKSVLDNVNYQDYLKNNPDADVALKQIDQYAVPAYIDPTGGAIYKALDEAIDKIEIENMPAKEALNHAVEKAQRELDKVNR